MFKSCRKPKKPPLPDVLSWRPIEEEKVEWPSRPDANKKSHNGQHVPEPIVSTYKTEKLQTIEIAPVQEAQLVKNKNTEFYIEKFTTEKQQRYEIKREIITHVNNNNYKLHQVQYGDQTLTSKIPEVMISEEKPPKSPIPQKTSFKKLEKLENYENQTPTITIPEVVVSEQKPKKKSSKKPSKILITEVDANENHITEVSRPSMDTLSISTAKKSDASIDSTHSWSELESMRLSTASGASVVMLRRKAYRDDDNEEETELQPQQMSQTDEDTIKKAIQANDFIMAVAPNAVESLARYMTLTEVRKGDVIMRQGERGNSMYVSKVGEYRVEINNQMVDTFKGPKLFGELAILYDTDRSATVLAMSDGSVWQLQRQIFRTLLRQSNILAKDNVLEFLRKVPVINETSSQKLRQIADLCESRYYPKDTIIIREGQKGDEFFIVKTGTAVASKMGQGKLKTYVKGDFFGERALLYDEEKRKATITSTGYGVECLVLTRYEFNKYLGDVRKFLESNDETPQNVPIPIIPPDPARFEPFKQIKLSDLKKVKLLGEGGFGAVHLVKTSKGKQFALKEMKLKTVHENQSLMKNAMNERDVQMACDCVFIVQLHKTLSDNVNIYFLLEYCPRAELFSLLRKKRHFPDPLAIFTGACVLEALAYLHVRRYAYLDLKPENICIDKNGYPKIADFGNAVMLEPGKKTFSFAGTPEYMAPEIIQRTGTDMAADYWAFGVLIYEMLMGKSPFNDRSEEKLYDNIIKGLTGRHFVPNFNKSAKDLIKRLIDVNPAKRLGCLRDGVNGLYKHDWFKDIDFPKLRSRQIKSPLLSLYKR